MDNSSCCDFRFITSWDAIFLQQNFTGNLSDLQTEFDSSQQDDRDVLKSVFLVIYVTICVIAFTGNIVVFYSVHVSRKRRKMDFLLVNFALTDTFMIFSWFLFTCLGKTVYQYWPFNAAMCKIFKYLENFFILSRSFSMINLTF